MVAVAGAACLFAAPQDTEVARNVPPAQQSAVEPPAKPVTPEVRGDIYMARKMYREAVETYRPLLEKNPIIHNKIGIAYHQMTDLDSARKYYERAIKLDPKYAEAINNLGTIHYAKKSYRRAVGQYQKALRLTPNSASIHSNLGTAHFARKNYKAAMAAYERALELDPEVFEHRNTAGVLLQERTVEERAKFYFYMAKTYAKAGSHERALIYIRKSLEEGFKERGKFVEDADFASLQELPEFKELMARQTRVL
ncbi:MAG: tetratricopeptide repeat protein [Bryobacteraceae bacterium]|nr:tetratricopeptide repeat protein [Bryobacteraceae bacterium]